MAMNKGRLKKKGLDGVVKELTSLISQQDWVSPIELEELDAIISHWLQVSSQVPFLSNSLLMEIRKYFQTEIPSPKIEISPCVAEGEASYQSNFDFLYDSLPYPPPKKWDFRFIDLFAGIGGFRIAFQKAGGKCVFSCEWDKYAKKTYGANFGEVTYEHKV